MNDEITEDEHAAEVAQQAAIEAEIVPTIDLADLPAGVLVVRQKDEQGNIYADAVPVGGVELDSVSTLLEMAYVNFRAKIGLPSR